MDLWIRSQDKEKLVKVNYLYLTDFNNRYGVYGETIDSNVKLGYYNSKQRALEVLDGIQKRIEYINNVDNNTFAECVYKMPEE